MQPDGLLPALALAMILDLLLGDPLWLPHPVRWMGKAIERLEPIIEAALQDKAYGEAVKAIGRKIALEGNIQGNKPEEKITRMQAEIADESETPS